MSIDTITDTNEIMGVFLHPSFLLDLISQLFRVENKENYVGKRPINGGITLLAF